MTGFGRELRDICGAEYVVEDPAQLKRYSLLGVISGDGGYAGLGGRNRGHSALRQSASLRVVPAGGFTQQETGNPPPQVDIVLLTTRLTEVEHYDPGDLTVGIGAGCTTSRNCRPWSASDRLLFAGDPALPERSTVGGLLATGPTARCATATADCAITASASSS